MDNQAWSPIIPLETTFGPEFPLEVLPEPLRSYVRSLADSYQVPVDLPAMLALTTTSVPLAKRVQIKPGPEWIEPCNLYTAIVLPPASRKSAIFKAITAPLEYQEKSLGERMVGVISDAKQQYRIIKKSLKSAEKKAADATDEERTQAVKEAQALRQQLPEVPKTTRILVDDISPEKLASLLSGNDGRIALMSAEGGVFDIISGRYSNNQPNLDVYLKGHAGDSLRVDRVGRESDIIESPALNIGLTIQPDVLRGLANKPGFRGRGLLARFSFIMPQSGIGYRSIESAEIPPYQRAAYHNIIRELFNKLDDKTAPVTFTLNPEASHLFKEFRAATERNLAPGGCFEHIQDWAGKYPGLVARIVAILHAINQVHNQQWETMIDIETIQSALSIGEYLAHHTEIAFSFMGMNTDQEAAAHILRWIKHKELSGFSLRDAHQALRGRYRDVHSINKGLDVLASHEYVSDISVSGKSGPGRKPSPKYAVNPKIHSQYPQNTSHSNIRAISENNENRIHAIQ